RFECCDPTRHRRTNLIRLHIKCVTGGYKLFGCGEIHDQPVCHIAILYFSRIEEVYHAVHVIELEHLPFLRHYFGAKLPVDKRHLTGVTGIDTVLQRFWFYAACEAQYT